MWLYTPKCLKQYIYGMSIWRFFSKNQVDRRKNKKDEEKAALFLSWNPNPSYLDAAS